MLSKENLIRAIEANDIKAVKNLLEENSRNPIINLCFQFANDDDSIDAASWATSLQASPALLSLLQTAIDEQQALAQLQRQLDAFTDERNFIRKLAIKNLKIAAHSYYIGQHNFRPLSAEERYNEIKGFIKRLSICDNEICQIPGFEDWRNYKIMKEASTTPHFFQAHPANPQAKEYTAIAVFYDSVILFGTRSQYLEELYSSLGITYHAHKKVDTSSSITSEASSDSRPSGRTP